LRSTKPLLVIDGLKLLAMQLKDVNVCATMVRYRALRSRVLQPLHGL
jgi:hypothetical protein